MSDALAERVAAFLAQHHVMTLATCDEDGPWAAAVFFAFEGLELYFLSSPQSRHARAIERDPRVAVTIQRDYRDWPEITGIQAEGRAAPVEGDERARVRRVYGERFPIVGRIGQAPAAIVEALARVHWYRFTPRRLFLIDNARGFGHRDEVDCGAGR